MTEMDTLTADANQIQQALVALLVNAVEAMPDGGELHVRASGTLDQIVLEIGDTGVGIAPEVLPHIFEPFVSTKADKGVGLGLAVVYGIVQRHEGTIDVSSAPGCGTTFRIALPRRLSAPDARSNPAQEQIAT
jgi:signal transduction histidine kinase